MKLDFDVAAYAEKIRKDSSYFHTFINRDALAAGVLVLQPGQKDAQEPHQSDEVYYVISGDGFLRIRGKDYRVSRNKLFFVAKDAKHYFHGNTRELRVLYFFGGPDS